MARKPRLEFSGALYHVISRGNYRKDIFEAGAAESFEATLMQSCEKCGWLLHAYVIMSNHYHLALETPEPNLVEGMRWLQGTFGIRFNAYRGERGHVFQFRYKSLVIEEGRPLLGLVNYIHLNQVRAGIVSLEGLMDYSYSSYPKFWARKPPKPMVRSRFLSALEFPDSISGMKSYARYLETSEESDMKKGDELMKKYSTGWAVASEEYRKELKERYAELGETNDWGGVDLSEWRETKWERVLGELMKKAGKTRADTQKATKSAKWKVSIARRMRATTTATNAWIGEALNMGHPTRVCNLVRKGADV